MVYKPEKEAAWAIDYRSTSFRGAAAKLSINELIKKWRSRISKDNVA